MLQHVNVGDGKPYQPINEYSPLISVVHGNEVVINHLNNKPEGHSHGGHGEAQVSSKVAVWNLFNDVLGPGTVALPYYVYQAGLGAGCLLILLFGMITTFTLEEIYLLYSIYAKKNYPELCKHVLGSTGYAVVCLAIFGFNFGGLCGQLMLFGTVIPDIMIDFFGPHELFTKTYLILFGCVVFVPISLFKDIAKFSFASFLSVSCIFAISACVFFRFFDKKVGDYVVPGHGSDESDHNPYKFVHYSVFSALGGLAYIFVCHDLSFNVISSLKNHTRPRYRRVVVCTMVVTVITCTAIGVSGYLLFFHKVKQNILENFPQKDVVATVGRCFLAFGVTLVVPFSCFMPRLSIVSVISALGEGPKKFANSTFGHSLITMLVLGSSVGIAIIVNNLGDVFELVGGVSACTIAFILPPILTIKGIGIRNISFFRAFMNIFVLVSGIIIMVGTSVDVFLN